LGVFPAAGIGAQGALGLGQAGVNLVDKPGIWNQFSILAGISIIVVSASHKWNSFSIGPAVLNVRSGQEISDKIASP
jgi:hypothetical protein